MIAAGTSQNPTQSPSPALFQNLLSASQETLLQLRCSMKAVGQLNVQTVSIFEKQASLPELIRTLE